MTEEQEPRFLPGWQNTTTQLGCSIHFEEGNKVFTAAGTNADELQKAFEGVVARCKNIRDFLGVKKE